MEAIKSTSVLNNTKEHSVSEVRECDRSVATTNPSDLSTLDDQSLEVLVQHYLSVVQKLPSNITARERLLELEREQFERERDAS
jgi:hypothetical protein